MPTQKIKSRTPKRLRDRLVKLQRIVAFASSPEADPALLPACETCGKVDWWDRRRLVCCDCTGNSPGVGLWEFVRRNGWHLPIVDFEPRKPG